MDISERKGRMDAGGELGFYDTLPFSHEKVPGDEREGYESGHKMVSGDSFLSDPWHGMDPAKMGDLEPALHECLMDIEQKLNLIIRHLSLQKEGLTVIPPEREIYISPSEIRFYAGEGLAPGDILKVRMILPLYPLAYIIFLCEVTDVSMLESGTYEVSAGYLNLNADEKDRIITYLFKKQRESIRNEKGK